MPTYAVTGASGPFGRAAVEALLARGAAPSDVVAIVRTPAKAADLAERGVQLRQADYNEPDTLGPALAGVDRLLLVSGSEVGQRVRQHTAVLEAAAAAGVGFLAYTSIVHADTTQNPLAAEHKATEEVLRGIGLPWAALRNSWYLENYTGQLSTYLERGEILGAAGTGRVAAALRADYADAAAAALIGDVAGETVYELGGPAFTMADLAQAITEVTGTQVTYRDVPEADFAAALRGAGLDEGTAGFVAALDASTARGELDTPDTDLRTLLGREPVGLREALRAAHAG